MRITCIEDYTDIVDSIGARSGCMTLYAAGLLVGRPEYELEGLQSTSTSGVLHRRTQIEDNRARVLHLHGLPGKHRGLSCCNTCDRYPETACRTMYLFCPRSLVSGAQGEYGFLTIFSWASQHGKFQLRLSKRW
jgi:hypothetical protein